VVLLGTSVVAGAFVGIVFDGTVRIQESNGQVVWQTTSHKGGALAILLMGCAMGCALVAIYKNLNGTSLGVGFSSFMVALVAWWLFATQMRGEHHSLESVATDTAALVIMIGVVMSPPTWRTVAALAKLLNITVVLCLAYSFLNPPGGQLPCRIDKCGIFGSLFTGFLANENSAGKLVASLVPAAAAIKSTRRMVLTLTLAGIFIAATGSRTALASFVIGLSFVVYLRRQDLRSENVHVSVVWRSLPLTALLTSAYLFLTITPADLTGRGVVFAGIRDQMTGYALILGSGENTMKRVAEIGGTGGVVLGGEHGQAPHLLVNAGVVGLVLFACALGSLVAHRHWTPTRALAPGFLLVASAEFLTEPGWALDTRTFDIVTMLFAVGAFVDRVPTGGVGVRGVGGGPHSDAASLGSPSSGPPDMKQDARPDRVPLGAPAESLNQPRSSQWP